MVRIMHACARGNIMAKKHEIKHWYESVFGENMWKAMSGKMSLSEKHDVYKCVRL